MPKISIVTSVYNSSEWLTEFMDSCVNQTLRDIEIICVDDCSPDNSRAILESYAKNDERIKLFYHTENQCGGTDTAMKCVSGEYVWIVDPDDVLELDACRLLYETFCTQKVPMIYFTNFDFYDKNIDSKKERPITELKPDSVINVKKMKPIEASVEPWHYCVKASIAKLIPYSEKLFFMDTVNLYRNIALVDSFYFLATPLYNYRIRAGSAEHSAWTEYKMMAKLTVAQKLYELTQTVPKKRFPALHEFTGGYIDYVIALAHDTAHTSRELSLLEQEATAFAKKSFLYWARKIASKLKRCLRA